MTGLSLAQAAFGSPGCLRSVRISSYVLYVSFRHVVCSTPQTPHPYTPLRLPFIFPIR